jgi:hypothetical protein
MRVTPTTVPCDPEEGVIEVRVGSPVAPAVTLKGTVAVVPAAVVTDTLCCPVAAVEAIARVAVTLLLFTTTTLETVTPAPVTPTVAGDTKPVPVSVIGTDVPWDPVEGLIDVRVGGDWSTVKPTVPLVPADVVTDTSRLPVAAPAAILRVAVIRVAFTTTTPDAVTPAPLTAKAAPLTKFVPVSATGIAVPCVPEEGVMEVSVGPGLEPETVKGNVALVPPTVFTAILRAPPAAPAAMVKVAPTWLADELVTTPVTPVPDMVRLPPVRLEPLIETGTAWPGAPLFGLILVMAGFSAREQ